MASDRWLYLGLILAWAAPVLAGLWWLGGHLIAARRRDVTVGILIPTLYLWAADRFAISDGIWDISNTYSVDWDPFGLPIEEAIFFLVTNLLVVKGMAMLLPLDPPRR